LFSGFPRNALAPDRLAQVSTGSGQSQAHAGICTRVNPHMLRHSPPVHWRSTPGFLALGVRYLP
jgi:hypothetical protein